MIDLHMHSTASDGTLTPTELVRTSSELGIAAIALTDHDTVNGVEEFLEAGARYGVETIPGVELSTEHEGCEVHVVGLFIDRSNASLLKQLEAFRDNRDNRNLQIIERLREKGFSITAEEIYAKNPGATIARPHIARHLVDTGQLPDISSVFKKYIGEGCPCFVDRMKVTPFEAVSLIHNAGGLAVLAHPCLYKKLSAEALEDMIARLRVAGLDAMEVIYSRNKEGDEARFAALASKYDLLFSGGTDFHGANKPDLSLGTGTGNLFVPYEFLVKMKERYQQSSF